MPFKVTYSGLNSNEPRKSPWADIIPYVSVDESRNWSASYLFKETTVRLEGSLTESGYNKLSSNYADFGYSSDPTANTLFPTGYLKIFRDTFSKCYGDLVVTDNPQSVDPTVILSGIYYVDSIDFSAQNFIGLLNYSIQLKRYDNLKYSGIEPSESISVQENGNGIVDITHSISAKGVGQAFLGNTPIAFDSVKTFVQDSTGINRIKNLLFASGFVPTGSGYSGVYVSGNGIGTSHSSNLILTSQTESINRLDNSYSVIENFKIDNLRSNQYAIKRFSANLNSGVADDYVVVNVNCSIEGAKDKSFSNVTGVLSNITGEMYSAATGIINNQTELCPVPIAFNINTTRLITGHIDATVITSVDGSSTIEANCSFDNSSDATFFDYDVSYDADEVRHFNNLNINGTIKGRGLHAAQKFYDASGYLFGIGSNYSNSLLNNEQDIRTMLYNKAVSAFNSIAPTGYADTCGIIGERNGQSFGFVKDKGTVTVNFDTGKGEIALSANFSDEDSVSGYNAFNWNAEVNVGVPLLVLKPSYIENGFNIIQEVGVTGASTYSFNGNFEFASGANGDLPILTKATQPHTGILLKLVQSEEFPDLSSNTAFTTSGIILNNYRKNFDFVSGFTSNSKDYLSSGFSIELSNPKQSTLPVYSTYSVTQ